MHEGEPTPERRPGTGPADSEKEEEGRPNPADVRKEIFEGLEGVRKSFDNADPNIVLEPEAYEGLLGHLSILEGRRDDLNRIGQTEQAHDMNNSILVLRLALHEYGDTAFRDSGGERSALPPNMFDVTGANLRLYRSVRGALERGMGVFRDEPRINDRIGYCFERVLESDDIRESIEEREISFNTDNGKGIWTCMDPRRFQSRVPCNLITNMLKYGCMAGGCSVREEDGYAVFEFWNGVDREISPEQEKSMFEGDRLGRPGYGGDEGVSNLGEGLQSVRRYVEGLGGEVWAEYSHCGGYTGDEKLDSVTGTLTIKGRIPLASPEE